MKRIALILLLLGGCGGEAAAREFTTGSLLNDCTTLERRRGSGTLQAAEYGFCLGVFTALLTTSHMTDRRRPLLPFCPPQEVTTGQMIAVFTAHARQRPAEYHWDARGAIFESMIAAFPCPPE